MKRIGACVVGECWCLYVVKGAWFVCCADQVCVLGGVVVDTDLGTACFVPRTSVWYTGWIDVYVVRLPRE